MHDLSEDTASPRQRGEEALRLASELTERIARERATVRALKEHLLATDVGGEDARLQPPRREVPAHVPTQQPWTSLGECLDYRRADPERGVVHLELSGEVDLSGALRLRQLITEVLDGQVRALCLELAEVSFMDSNALSALLWIRRRAMLDEVAFSISAVHPQLRRLLAITRLDGVLLG